MDEAAHTHQEEMNIFSHSHNEALGKAKQSSQESLQMACESKERKLAWSVYGRGLCGLNLLLVSKERAPEFAQLGDIRKEEGVKLKATSSFCCCSCCCLCVCVWCGSSEAAAEETSSRFLWLTKRPKWESRLRTMIILI